MSLPVEHALTLRLGMCLRPPLLTHDSGPGRRWVLYLQGCARPCTTECLNPGLLDPAGGRLVGLDDLRLVADQVVTGQWGAVEGITVLGGEPTDQAEALHPLLSHARSLGLSIMLYSGHPLAWFHRPPQAAARRLLDVTDILVDGPFIPALADPSLRWRGSSNQMVRRLTTRYSDSDLEASMAVRGVTVTRRHDGVITINGLQDRDHVTAARERLAESLAAPANLQEG
jgi:anaerobic ribonucleoside-triphosphate reductase activating protein